MATVTDLLSRKGPHVYSIGPDATVLVAAQLMNEHRIGCLVVMEDGRVCGMFSERDVLQRVVAECRDPARTLVREVMTADVICGRPSTTVEAARGVMKNRRIRHLPVVDDGGELCGLVSIGDLNAHEAHDHELTIHLLQQYIYGQA